MISQLIETLNEAIEELHGAKSYIEEALTLKELNKQDFAKQYYELACDELKHASTLKDMAHEYKSHIEPEHITPDLNKYIDMLCDKYRSKLLKVKVAIMMYEGKLA